MSGGTKGFAEGGGAGKSRVEKRTCGKELVGNIFWKEIKKIPTCQD